MVKYITLWHWTPQGLSKIADTLSRAEAFARELAKAGSKVLEFYWCVGEYDGCIIHEAPDEFTAVANVAGLAKLGNVQTQTLRAFDAGEMKQILLKMK
jgi:uncharacterized protein with GYD domain